MNFMKKCFVFFVHNRQYRLIKRLIKAGNSISFDSHVSSDTVLEGKNKIKKAIIDDSIIGMYSYIKAGSFLPKTKIGRFSSIGTNVIVEPATHSTDGVSSHPMFETKEQFLKTENGFFCEIGNDVWIGRNVLIKGGVKIGDGAVIGMGAIVTKDVSSYAIVGGNPAKLIRYRFDDETIKRLQETAWWNLDCELIKKNKELFANTAGFSRFFEENPKIDVKRGFEYVIR